MSGRGWARVRGEGETKYCSRETGGFIGEGVVGGSRRRRRARGAGPETSFGGIPGGSPRKFVLRADQCMPCEVAAEGWGQVISWQMHETASAEGRWSEDGTWSKKQWN